MNRTIEPFSRVYKNLHNVTPLTLVVVVHRQIKKKTEKENVHLNIMQ